MSLSKYANADIFYLQPLMKWNCWLIEYNKKINKTIIIEETKTFISNGTIESSFPQYWSLEMEDFGFFLVQPVFRHFRNDLLGQFF